MFELIQKLGDTPLPQIFIIAGIFFLILSVVNKFGGKLDINPKRQGQAILIGIVLIVVGLSIYLQPPHPEPPGPINGNDYKDHECLLSIYSMSNNDEFIARESICKIHISKGIPSKELVDQEKENTRFIVRINDHELKPISDIHAMEDENGEWHLNQFFEFHDIEPGQRYKIEGKTFEANGNLVDSRVFYMIRK